MKRIRLETLSSRMLAGASTTRTARATTIPSPITISRVALCPQSRRWQSVTAFFETLPEEYERAPNKGVKPLPSPLPSQARKSAKLAALHARLSLSSNIPLETLARTLVDASADADPRFNNANLAYVGNTLLNYHASEYLISRYPRLPMTILFAAMKGLVGPPALNRVAKSWGVEAAAAPGEEVDSGFLQFSREKPSVQMNQMGYVRTEAKELAKYKWRRGQSSRVLYDDAFGDLVPAADEVAAEPVDLGPQVSGERNTREVITFDPSMNAHANHVRAVIGAIYMHRGREAAKSFLTSYILSRRLDLTNLFRFKIPTRELMRLCARENFDAPVARLLSETGRMSRTPVFVVGIYSGRDKLGEGTGASLDAARISAAMNALKAWYLYSPGDKVAVPSDTLSEDAAPWKPLYVDIGEVIS